MVTSSSPLEGKSITAANLAIVMAQSGKSVVLVDTDLRRPVQHRVFKLTNTLGLTSLLLDSNLELSRALQPTSVPNLRVLTSGPLPPNPSELLSSNRMGSVIEALRQSVDVAIFDSPPVLAVSDSAVLAGRVDGVLLVVRAARTRQATLRQSKEALVGVGAHLLGVVLNRLAVRERSYGSYYDYTTTEKPSAPVRSSGLVARLLRRNGHPQDEGLTEMQQAASLATDKTTDPQLRTNGK
jgi:capsular exopolysaccharide synthesis family protein